ncbi:alpha/beta hydrolase [Flavobacterium beibuense]|uniref:Alpha/beta hydrolase n=1 Tax=Flavobacterium beibuense TaxID=657326 RepID=A0A444WEN1_9FLAO|nr:alpha/beta hydrolase [Flavobacterium beibuense]RYJ44226.1 Alpha/beta hydrolase [Flavobacterium beibuense]
MTQIKKAPNFLEDGHLVPGVRAFLKSINTGGPGVETLSIEQARKVLVDLQNATPVNLSGIEESEKTITTEGHHIKLTIVRPEGVKATLPAFMFIHGGGWVLGDYPTHRRLVRDIVVASGFAAVFVNYTPSPEAPYPQATEEIYAATKWVAANGHEINVDGKTLAIVGNSVGGNMTAVTCLKSMANSGPVIKLAVMMWPIVDANFEHESYQLFGEDRFLTTPLMKWMYDTYTKDPKERKEIYASPLEATVEQLKGFPPALIQVAENDVLRDGGEAFGRKLAEAGGEICTVRYNGVIHDWGLLNGLAGITETKALIAQISIALKNHLK